MRRCSCQDWIHGAVLLVAASFCFGRSQSDLIDVAQLLQLPCSRLDSLLRSLTWQRFQVANVEFFNETLPLFDAGDDVGMVLSPQSFYNVDLNADVFNHCNIQFWEYAQHGYDAIGFNSCTGTPPPPSSASATNRRLTDSLLEGWPHSSHRRSGTEQTAKHPATRSLSFTHQTVMTNTRLPKGVGVPGRDVSGTAPLSHPEQGRVSLGTELGSFTITVERLESYISPNYDAMILRSIPSLLA